MSVLTRIIELHSYAKEQYIQATTVTLSQKSYDELCAETSFLNCRARIPDVLDTMYVDGLAITVIDADYDHIVIK